jgi:serine protease AprX
VSLRVPGSRIDEDHPEARVGDHHFRGSGTSMSTALVAGAAAVLTELRPFATPDDVKGALRTTAAAVPGSRAGAIDLAAADAAEASSAWRQRHPIAGPALPGGAKAMPWASAGAPPSSVTWERVRWLDDQWQRVRWLDDQWQRVRWLEDDWARVRWLEDGWARVRWLDGEWQRVRWLDGEWQRVRWLDADLARVRWLESHFSRVRWLDGDWARVRWLDLAGTPDGGVESPAAFERSDAPARTPGAVTSEAGIGRPGSGPANSGNAPGKPGRP